MNHRFVLSFLLFLTVWSLPLPAKQVKDTLRSVARDKVFMNYDISYQDNDVTITFTSVNPIMANSLDSKYKLKDIKVLFFERDGGFIDDIFIGDIATKSLSVKIDDMDYERSSQGYVWLDGNTELRLRLHADEATLSLPVYLAHYEKKNTYKIIADCGQLNIHLDKKNTTSSHSGQKTGIGSRTIITTEEVGSDEPITKADEVEIIMGRMENSLLQAPTAGMLSDLRDDCAELRRLEPFITENDLRSRINSMLQRVRDYEQENEVRSKRDEEAEQTRLLLKNGRNDMDYLNERLDNIDNLSEGDLAELKTLANQLRRSSKDIQEAGGRDGEQLAGQMVKAADRCDAEMKKIEDAKKQRSIWMIIGGIALVVLMFVGNQVFQHVRNMRNQKSIKDMQHKMAEQAKNETQRRMRNAVRSRVNHAESTIMQESRNAVRSGMNKGVNSIVKNKGGKRFTV